MVKGRASDLYRSYMRKTLEDTDNLDILQDTVASLIIENDQVQGVKPILDQ